MTKTPTRSPTHEDVPLGRLSAMGLELEEIADDDQVELSALVEVAEDRGRPASHYLAALPLATELRLAATPGAALTVKVCAGTCQRWGSLDVLEHLVDKTRGGDTRFSIVPVECLDRCDHAPACEVHGDHGQLVLAPVTTTALDEALDELAR
jgi:NADH:ubiquinone oxidoreductase subunit E